MYWHGNLPQKSPSSLLKSSIPSSKASLAEGSLAEGSLAESALSRRGDYFESVPRLIGKLSLPSEARFV